MWRRLVALVLALAVAGASETLAICQVACTSWSAAEAESGSHHAHHSPASPSDASIAIGAHDNLCHDAAISALTAPSPLRTVSFAILPAVVTIKPPSIRMPARVIRSPGNQFAAVPLATPLRL